MKYRQVVAYKTYFDEFFKDQNEKVQKKIIRVLDIVEQIERIPQNYLKYRGYEWLV